MRNKNFIQSLSKGFDVLELLSESSEPLSLTRIAEHMGTNKTTARRFLYTLAELGYIQADANKRYMLGSKILKLAFPYLQNEGIYSIARPYLENLSNDLARSVSMGILDGTAVLVVFRKEKTRFYPYAVYVGSRLPLHCTTMGKVLLAALDPKKQKELLEKTQLAKVTPKTETNIKQILEELALVRHRGYAISNQEFSLDLYSIGVPLLDNEGQVAAAVTLSLRIDDKENREIMEGAMERLFSTGSAISKALGYKGAYPTIPL